MYSTQAPLQDQIHIGRMIVLGIGIGYVAVWALDFLYRPSLLFPGAFLDPTHRALFELIGALIQFVLVGTFWILSWAGLSWARYTLAVFLLIGGVTDVVLSILIGSEGGGGAPLVLGSMCLAGAVALVASLSVQRYLEDRRRRGFPSLTVGSCLLGMYFLLIALGVIQGLQTWLLVQANEHTTAIAESVFRKVIPALDVSAIEPLATEDLKQQMVASDLAGQVNEVKKTLGNFQSWPGLTRATVQDLVLQPESRSTQGTWQTLVHYNKGDLLLQIEMDASQSPAQVKSLYFQRSDLKRPGK